MDAESSRFRQVAQKGWGIAAVVAIAVFGAGAGFAVSGCGSDDNSDKVNNAIDSIQSQASSVQSQISSAATNVQSQAQSVSSQIQSQAQSVQSQVQSQTQSNGGSGVPGY
jgi:2,4-dienoyl-CoA reductase-like NADH-dependent reductase (Old Yellow Enzyme family)